MHVTLPLLGGDGTCVVSVAVPVNRTAVCDFSLRLGRRDDVLVAVGFIEGCVDSEYSVDGTCVVSVAVPVYRAAAVSYTHLTLPTSLRV